MAGVNLINNGSPWMLFFKLGDTDAGLTFCGIIMLSGDDFPRKILFASHAIPVSYQPSSQYITIRFILEICYLFMALMLLAE
jgi:hypothetical protein